MAVIFWIAIITIIRATNSETVDPKEKLRADLSNIKDQLNGMQGNTEDLRKSLDTFSEGLDEYIKREDAEDVYNDRLAKANAVVLGTSKAIPKFKSGDPGQIISGVLDMTSMALTTFGGPYGAAAAVVVNIVSSLIGLFMTTPKSTPTLEQVMKDVLDEFTDEQLFKRMNSFVTTLGKIHGGIVASRKLSSDVEGNDLTEGDITQLHTMIDLFSTDTLLGDVKQNIADEIISEKVSDANRALKTINVYCKLNIVVELVLVEFINYIKEEGPENNKLPTFYHSFMSTTRKNDKEYLGFLHLPEVTEALVAAIYQNAPEKYPELRQYIESIKVAPIPESGLEEGKTIYLTPKKWPKWHFYLSSESHSLIYGSTNTNDQNKFILKKASSGEEGREWMIENKYYPNYFISARKFESCLPLKHPDEVDYVEGLTMSYINRIKRNCGTQCLANGKCSGCYSNCYSTFKIGRLRNLVSINYVWRFTKLKSSGRCLYYFISATQENFGPGYTLFMKDSNNANAYLKYGNPKEKGMFKLVKNSCK